MTEITRDKSSKDGQKVSSVGLEIKKRFIGIKELAIFLNIAKGTVYGWVYLKKIPYLKIGRLVKFDLQEIELWLKARKIKEII